MFNTNKDINSSGPSPGVGSNIGSPSNTHSMKNIESQQQNGYQYQKSEMKQG
jgi:hypothetical protein